MSYTIDTSVIITLHRQYPRDVHRSAWEHFEELIESGEAFLPKDGYEELERKSDELAPWAKGLDGFVEDPTEDEIETVQEITEDHPDWVQEQANAADPWVIANAAVNERVVVTQERRCGPNVEDRNIKIPNVADEHDVDCIDFNELARREGWVF